MSLSTTHSLLLMARAGHSTLASTTKREIKRISLPPPRVSWRPYDCARQSKFVDDMHSFAVGGTKSVRFPGSTCWGFRMFCGVGFFKICTIVRGAGKRNYVGVVVVSSRGRF